MKSKFWNRLAYYAITIMVSTTFAACGGDDDNPLPDPPGGETENPDDEIESPVLSCEFAHGADVSWITQIEEEGYKFYNSKGQEADALKVLKDECSVDAVRLRVWVNPVDKWNGIEDVVVKARRATVLGMKIMIDFHLSDTWADPGNQTVPVAWQSVPAGAELAEKVYEHVESVLTRLHNEGVTPEWVQIGNETSSGMLWESGRVVGNSTGEFVRYFNAGAAAAKAVFPEIKVILHLNGGQDHAMYTWFFELMKKHKANYDIIGMSLYPETETGSGASWQVTTDKGAVKNCKTNIRSLYSTYGKPIMISEIGFHFSNGDSAYDVIKSFIEDFKDGNILQGIFYWEPEAPEGFNGYSKGAFENGRPNKALKAFVE